MGSAVLLAQVGRDRGLDLGGQLVEVEGLVGRDASGLEDLADLLLGAVAIGDRGRVVVGLADLEQQRVDVDRLAVDGRAHEQLARAGDRCQRAEQVVEQDVVGGERRDLGERGVELPFGLQQRRRRAAPSFSASAASRRRSMSG